MSLKQLLRRYHLLPARAEDIAAAREEYGISDPGKGRLDQYEHVAWPSLSEGAGAAEDDLAALEPPPHPGQQSPRRPT